MVQVLNILGAVRFDCATSKLPEPHARAHLSSLDPRDAAPMEDDAREALRQSMLALMDETTTAGAPGQPRFSYAHPIFWAPYALVGDPGR